MLVDDSSSVLPDQSAALAFARVSPSHITFNYMKLTLINSPAISFTSPATA